MAITKKESLKGYANCLNCYSLIQWDEITDIKVSNGNEYVVCPNCGNNIPLRKGQDYWFSEQDAPTPKE